MKKGMFFIGFVIVGAGAGLLTNFFTHNHSLSSDAWEYAFAGAWGFIALYALLVICSSLRGLYQEEDMAVSCWGELIPNIHP